MRRPSLAILTALLARAPSPAVPAHAKHPTIEKAERAIAAGRVVPSRDVRPVLDALRRASTVDEKRELVDAIADWGETDGDAPHAGKTYPAEGAAPLLLAG